MKYSSLALVSLLALSLVSEAALAKTKHRHVEQQHDCPTITHYFTWFSTSQNVCLDDMLDHQFIRHMMGEGNHNAPSGSNKVPG
jgi:hypothetical protein